MQPIITALWVPIAYSFFQFINLTFKVFNLTFKIIFAFIFSLSNNSIV